MGVQLYSPVRQGGKTGVHFFYEKIKKAQPLEKEKEEWLAGTSMQEGVFRLLMTHFFTNGHEGQSAGSPVARSEVKQYD